MQWKELTLTFNSSVRLLKLKISGDSCTAVTNGNFMAVFFSFRNDRIGLIIKHFLKFNNNNCCEGMSDCYF